MFTLLFQQNFNPHYSIFTEVDLIWAAIWGLAVYNALITVFIFYKIGVAQGKKKKSE